MPRVTTENVITELFAWVIFAVPLAAVIWWVWPEHSPKLLDLGPCHLPNCVGHRDLTGN